MRKGWKGRRWREGERREKKEWKEKSRIKRREEGIGGSERVDGNGNKRSEGMEKEREGRERSRK